MYYFTLCKLPREIGRFLEALEQRQVRIQIHIMTHDQNAMRRELLQSRFTDASIKPNHYTNLIPDEPLFCHSES